nr:hypothetical protein [Tanacetum cinerariifolium]
MVKEGIILDHKVSDLEIEIRNKKGAKNLAADHLSWLENLDLGKLVMAEIRDLFPEERLMAVSDKNNESWWYGRFSVRKDMRNGAIELCDEDGNEFIVNKQRVKPYQKDVLDTNRDDNITLDDEGELTIVHPLRGDGVAGIQRRWRDLSSDVVRKLTTLSGRNLLISDLEDSSRPQLDAAPPSLDYIPGPEHADDEIIAEDQPHAEDTSPIALLPEYVPESDFEMHPEDDDDEDPEDDPVDYPADGGDDGDDEEESSEDEEDDEMDVEADEEEEHPNPADSVVVAPTAADQAPSAEETEPFETDEFAATPPPYPTYRTTARISIPAQVPMPAWTDSEFVRLHAISSPPASPLSPWSSPPPQILFHRYTRYYHHLHPY